MKYLLVIIFLCLYGCFYQKNKLSTLFQHWDNKLIIFPNTIKSISNEKDSINGKVLIYTDSLGCFSCKLQLEKWLEFKHYIDSITNHNISFIFCFSNRNYKKVQLILKMNNVNFPVYIDTEDSLNILNRFPEDERFHTFLLDRNNRVKVIGNPVLNPKIKELYLKVITGDTLPEKQAAQTTVGYETTVCDLGEFTPKESREAVFSLKNTGTQPLLVADVVTSCGCATPRYDKKPVNPGGTMKITVEMKIKEEGYFEKTISVYCNTPDSPVRFRIKGRIVHEK